MGKEECPILSQNARSCDTVETHVYKRSWWIMTVFILMTIVKSTISFTWGPIAEASEIVLGWNSGLIAMLTNLVNISYVITVIPIAMFMDAKGLRIPMLIISACMLVGTGIRCINIHNSLFKAMAEICALLTGIAATIPNSGPSLVASVWFPPSQRTTATALASLSNYFGFSLAFLVGPLVVTNPQYDISMVNGSILTRDEYKTTDSPIVITSNGLVTNVDTLEAGIQNLMYIHCCAAAVIFILILLYFPTKPPTPPSQTAAIQRTGYRDTLGEVWQNRSLWLIVAAFSLPSGVTSDWSAMMDLNIKHLGVSQITTGWMGFSHIICGCVSGIVVARFSEIFERRRKEFLVTMLILATASSLWFLILCAKIIEFNLPSLYIACILIGIFNGGTIPLLYEMAVECSYPVAEGVTGGILTLGSIGCGSVFLTVFSVSDIGTIWMNIILTGTYIITLPVVLASPEQYKRSDIDLNIN